MTLRKIMIPEYIGRNTFQQYQYIAAIIHLYFNVIIVLRNAGKICYYNAEERVFTKSVINILY
jgi:hypothetical protein